MKPVDMNLSNAKCSAAFPFGLATIFCSSICTTYSASLLIVFYINTHVPDLNQVCVYMCLVIGCWLVSSAIVV